MPGEPGPRGREGPAGPAGGESVPRSATLTRDANGSVASVTVEGEDTWTISRNADLSVASLTDTKFISSKLIGMEMESSQGSRHTEL